MSNWTGKSKGTPLGYRIFIALIRLDIRLAYGLLLPVSFFYFFFSNKKAIAYFYKERLEFTSIKANWHILLNYIQLGKVLIDKIAILSGNKNFFSFDFNGEEYLHEMVQNKQGGLLLGAHMGNWEVAGELLERVDSVINILMVNVENVKLKEVIEKSIQKKKVNIISIKEDMSHIFEVVNAFKRKELVAMHGDRFLEDNQTVSVNFLGASARFPIGPMMLATKYKIPVSFVFSMKKNNRHYQFYATQGKIYPNLKKKESRQDNLHKMVSEYVSNLEKMVKRYPTQWFNYHQFWENETVEA